MKFDTFLKKYIYFYLLEPKHESFFNHLKKMMHLENTKLLIKEKNIEKAIAFLYTDKAISKGIDIPKDIGYNFDNPTTEDIEQLKTELFNSTTTMLNFLTKNTDFRAVHPFFGELRAEQWLLFQKKHFTHHLSQFGLL